MYANAANGFSDDALLNTIPAAAGITGDDLTAYQSCYNTKATGQFVDKVIKAADVAATPEFFLNGEDVRDKLWNANTQSYDPDKLRELLGMD